MPMQELGLSNLQKELLKLYGNGVSDESLFEIKHLLSKYFAEKANDEMDKIWEERNLAEEDLLNWTDEHNRTENRS